MAEPISVQCPKCRAKLKLKSSSAVGKKVPCPRCKRPFIVEAAAEPEDEFDDFGALDEFDSYEDDASGDEFDERPVSRPKRAGKSAAGRRGKSAKGKKKRKKAGGAGWVKPLAIGIAAIAFLSLMIGAGFLVASRFGGGVANKINLAYLPPDAELIIALDVDEVWKAPLVQSMAQNEAVQGALNRLTEQSGIKPEEIDSVVFGASGLGEAAQQVQQQPALGMVPSFNSMHGVAVVRSKLPIDTSRMMKEGQTETLDHQGQTYYRHSRGGRVSVAAFLADDKTLVTGPEADVKAAIERGGKQEHRADLDFINNKHHLLIVSIPNDPSGLTSQAKDSLAALPDQVRSISEKLDGKVVGSCIGLTFSDGFELEIRGNCPGAGDAEAVRQELSTLLDEGRQKFVQSAANVPPNFTGLVNVAKSILDRIAVSANSTTFAVTASVTGSDVNTIKEAAAPLMPLLAGQLAAGLPGAQPPGGMPNMTPPGSLPGSARTGLPTMGESPGSAGLGNPLVQAREAARRAQCKNNLKQIGLALHNFHDANGKLPAAASAGPDGKPLLSWRVQILPYLGQETLYEQFKLDEPWDSEHNKNLIGLMPTVFACPSGGLKPGTTTYLGVSGEKAIFNGTQRIGFRDVIDGTSNTIMVVEADDARAVVWTKPDDFAYADGSPSAGLSGKHTGGFHALFCDGRVMHIQASNDKAKLAGLFTANGGEKVTFP